MAEITIELIKKLRTRTGVGMMDCKKALIESGGDLEAAVEYLRKKGTAFAEKRAGKTTSEGIVEAYIHPGNNLGVLVEINCETDFVARTEDVKNFAKDLCLHIAALKPLYLSPEEVDPMFLEHERMVLKEQLADSGKKEEIVNQIVEGKIKKLFSEICLLQQPFVKNDQFTVKDMVKELIAKVGENIKIKQFARYEIGS